MQTTFDNTEIAFRYRSAKQLKLARLLFGSMQCPAISRAGIAFTKLAMKLHLPVKQLIRQTLFRQFCGGETIAEAARTADYLGRYSVGVILDYGVEGKESEQQFDNATGEFINAINFAASQQNIPFISLKVTAFSRFALLEKIHAGNQLTASERDEWQKVQSRINAICKCASERGIMVLIDAEETWIQEPVNTLTNEMMEKYNKVKAVVFNTFQLYSKGTLSFLQEATREAAARGYILGAKLVRGAYMEKERARAAEMGYEDPIQVDKASTDRDFDSAVTFCLQHLDKLALFIGTHNERSCMQAAAYMEQHRITPGHARVFFSQLYGMGDNISFNLASSGYSVVKYLPYGPVGDVIPYLLRRAQENTSVAGQTGRELGLIKAEIKRRRKMQRGGTTV